MKKIKAFMLALSLVGVVGSSGIAAAVDGVISKNVLGTDSYCHLKFPAMDEASLRTEHPFLKSPNSGDIIDFYGSCDHDPLGKNEINAQLLQLQHRRDRAYSG